jgi:hypothetical protein
MGKRNLEPEKVAQVLDMLKSTDRLTNNAISIAVGVSAPAGARRPRALDMRTAGGSALPARGATPECD